MWKKILCPVDFTDVSRVASDYAASLASQWDGTMTLVHVFDPQHHPNDDAIDAAETITTPELMDVGVREIQPKLERYRAELNGGHGGDVETVVLHGSAPEQIVQYAREHGCDMIVMGTHGRTGLKRLVARSVTDGVVRHAPCPVLVVHEEDRAAA